MNLPTVDILYLAHGRHDFTSISIVNLIRNTTWSHPAPRAFYICTDGDRANEEGVLGPLSYFKIDPNPYGGPVAVLNHYLSIPGADYICKIDNDTMVPPGWLEVCLHTLAEYPVDLLGIEAWAPDHTVFPTHVPSTSALDAPRYIRPTTHIGGIGFYRRVAFANSLPAPNGRFGLTEWQWTQSNLKVGFLDPPLPIFLLDHAPFSPFKELNAKYDSTGEQRRVWGEYPASCSHLWDWWLRSTSKERTTYV